MKLSFILMGLMLIPWGNSLVHWKKLEPGANGGCKGTKGDLKVGQTEDDPLVCGVLHCSDNAGNAFIHYCQIPITVALCPGKGVTSEIMFPDCCWICTTFKNC
ncbi:uncharacterized protein LOC117587474 [Drosophila guanche]|uniref:Single domain-containing protein n=1 Tax=Drosophila guanche TaxID=7266 RepID=A0A3B0J196_DROGU|nr:uncharacterized protein LOC117587474 [Drosophila guanche]SPP74627.1 Hypothetical predicted protein [Drosophila guanche]